MTTKVASGLYPYGERYMVIDSYSNDENSDFTRLLFETDPNGINIAFDRYENDLRISRRLIYLRS